MSKQVNTVRTVTLTVSDSTVDLDSVISQLPTTFPGVVVSKVWKKKGKHVNRSVNAGSGAAVTA